MFVLEESEHCCREVHMETLPRTHQPHMLTASILAAVHSEQLSENWAQSTADTNTQEKEFN